MSNTLVSVTLSFIGDSINPDVITSELNILPTNTWRKGDPLPRNKLKTRLESVWEYSTGYTVCNDVAILLESIIKKFTPLIGDIKELKEKHSLIIKVFIVIHIENSEVPAQYYDKQVLEFLHNINAELDVDLYIMS
jgi:hypothetical protein